MVVPLLKKVDETIAGIIISIENGFEIPPVKYNKEVNWIKSYIKYTLALRSFTRIDFILNWSYILVKKPKNIIAHVNKNGKSNLR